MVLSHEIKVAETRIRPSIRETPLDFSAHLSRKTNCSVYLKLENLQYTGSFKVRGAFNKLLSLSPDEQARGIVTASTGNHGAAVAYGLEKLKLKGSVFVPEHASSTKVEAIKSYGVPLHFYGADGVITEAYARKYATQHRMAYISPYNDIHVVAGQGTIGEELTNQIKVIDAVFVPVGGGGLISGIASSLKNTMPRIKIIGCLPQSSPIMEESVRAGHIIEKKVLSTLSDATAGGIEPGSITFELCRKLVDEYVLVTEEEIKEAIRLCLSTQHMLIEGAAGVALASFLKKQADYQKKNVVVILSGANISLENLRDAIC